VFLAVFIFVAAGMELAHVIAEERPRRREPDPNGWGMGAGAKPAPCRLSLGRKRGRGVWQLAPVTAEATRHGSSPCAQDADLRAGRVGGLHALDRAVRHHRPCPRSTLSKTKTGAATCCSAGFQQIPAEALAEAGITLDDGDRKPGRTRLRPSDWRPRHSAVASSSRFWRRFPAINLARPTGGTTPVTVSSSSS